MSPNEEYRSETLTDPFTRKIDYLRISVTDRCNLRCIYCTPKSGVKLYDQSELLTSHEIAKVAAAAHSKGIRKVRITGGEPLMREDIVPLVATLKREIGISSLSLTTNGVLLAGAARALKDAGLDRVNISLDTMIPRRYRTITRGGDIGRVWDAISEAENAGLHPVKINVVPMRGMNDDEISDFARLTFEKDYHVRFIELMPVGRSRWERDASMRKEEVAARVSSLGRLTPLEFRGQGPSRNFRIEGARGVVGFISPVSDHFCGWCNRLRLTATGSIRPCLFSDAEFDLRPALRSGAADEELGRFFASAIASKPRGHALDGSNGSLRAAGFVSMSQIGG